MNLDDLLLNESSISDIEDNVIKFLSNGTDIETLLKKTDKEKLIKVCYSLLKDFFNYGTAKKLGKKSFDSSKLEKGIKVEMEHTRNKVFASKIAKDHLAENKNYYEWLEIFEKLMDKYSDPDKWKKENL
jgi:hypothetical protein